MIFFKGVETTNQHSVSFGFNGPVDDRQDTRVVLPAEHWERRKWPGTCYLDIGAQQ